jgi:hypothetical protein
MVTWEALARVAIGIIGAGMAGFGVLRWFAAGMMTAPDPAEGRKGCGNALLGLAIIACAIFA